MFWEGISGYTSLVGSGGVGFQACFIRRPGGLHDGVFKTISLMSQQS